MTIKVLPLVLGLMLSFHSAAQRWIGETPAQVEARLGPSKESKSDPALPAGTVVQSHAKGNYQIIVIYYKGVSQSELYTKNGGAEFSEAELDAILQNNVLGGKWEREPYDDLMTEWAWAGHKMQAVYLKLTSSPKFFLQTAAFKADSETARLASEKNAATGL